MTDLSRLAIHTQTTRPWDLRTCCARYAAAGVAGLSVWRHLIDPDAGGVAPREGARMIADSGLRVPALVRAGFFVSPEASGRRDAIDDARNAIEDAAILGAHHVVLVVGADPAVALEDAREMVGESIRSVADEATAAGVRLAIEPLHPMYAADRSCVNSLATANDLCARIDHDAVGIAVDVYHVWWEPNLADEIGRASRAHRLLGFHICDWRTPLRDPLNDRGLMGDGCIDVASLSHLVDDAGFVGLREVEVFNDEYWRMDMDAYLALIIERYRACGLGER